MLSSNAESDRALGDFNPVSVRSPGKRGGANKVTLDPDPSSAGAETSSGV